MRRISCAAALALPALAPAATTALAHGGGSVDYISEVRAVEPAGAGIDVEVNLNSPRRRPDRAPEREAW